MAPPDIVLPQRANRRRRRSDADSATNDGASTSAAGTSTGAAGPSELASSHLAEATTTTTSAAASADAWWAADAPMQHEYLDHTADVQLHSWGGTVEEAFEQQVLGVMGLITELPTVRIPMALGDPSALGGVDAAHRMQHVREVSAEGHDSARRARETHAAPLDEELHQSLLVR